MNIFFASLLAFAPLAALSPRKLSALEWVWFLGFGWLALTGLRYVIWFLFIVTILIASLLAEWTKKLDQPKQTFPALNYWIWNFYAGDFVDLFTWHPRALDGRLCSRL